MQSAVADTAVFYRETPGWVASQFLGLLILITLPYPAEFGSDVIREWPHILFLSTGLLFLIWGSRFGKCWMFAVGGLATGFGHTIRPECAQIVVYGILWFLISLFFPRPNISRLKAVCATLILLIGFAIPAAPYMKVRGRVLPPKLKSVISCNTPRQSSGLEQSGFDNTVTVYTASGMPTDILTALGRLARATSENLMYFFVLPLMVGLYCHFHRPRKILLTERFFIFALIALYLVMMLLLHINYSYIGRRHSMPIIVFTAFYIPVGLQILARWLSKRTSKSSLSIKRNRQRWFFILMAVGFGICTAKFGRITPLRWEKQGYLDTAKWLKENTEKENIIIVPDARITFYAERKGFENENANAPVIPVPATYIVRSTDLRYLEESKSDKTFRYNAGEVEDDSEIDTFSSEIKRYSSLKRLVGYWAANDDTLDYSIYRNHATAHGGVSYATSKYGQAFNLVLGMNSYIDCGDNSSLNPIDSITVSAWIYPVTNSRGSLITRNGPYFIEFLADRRIYAGVYAGSLPSWTFAVSESALSLHTWHHVVMTYDGSHIRIYVDGEIDGTPTVKSGDMAITQTSVYIGYGLPGLDHYFNGLIDEVMLFDTALQLDQIKALNKMVESKTVPTFGTNADGDLIFDCWKKIERKYSLWVDERNKKKKLCIYKIE